MLNEPHAVAIRKGPPRPQDAIAPIPAGANAYELTTEDDIGDALTALAETGDPISMYVPGNREPVLGRILSVDPEKPHFVMELNEGMSLGPGKVTFVSWLRSAKIQFRLTDYDWKTLPDKPNLVPMTFPETCAVLNRRAAERVETPLGAPFTAFFVTNGTAEHNLPINDFSLGGIGLECAKVDAKGLLKGRKLLEVQLNMGDETILVAEMEVRYTRAIRSFLMGDQLHIGCMFTQLAPEELSKLKRVIEQVSATQRR